MERKWVKHLILIILIAIPLYFLNSAWTSCNNKNTPQYKYETVTGTEPRVYITKTGDCYHNSSCSYLKSKIAIGKYEAQNKGYRACSRCHGTASGTISVSYNKKVQLSESELNRKYLWADILLTIIGAPIIYGIGYGIVIYYKEERQYKTCSATKTNGKTTNNQTALHLPHGSQITEREKFQKEIEKYSEDQIQALKYRVVVHKTFGEGYISKITREYVWVIFSNKEEKMFQFPDAFVKEILEYKITS